MYSGFLYVKKVVAYQVNSPAARDLAQELGCDFTQGTCIAEQTASKVHRVDHTHPQ